MTERSECPYGCVDGMLPGNVYLENAEHRCPWPGHTPTDAPRCPECMRTDEHTHPKGEPIARDWMAESIARQAAPRSAGVKRYSLAEIAQTVIPADKPAWVSIESYAALEARVAAFEAERDRLREALMELRSCSRAKIGMEDDFACADAQMRQALHPTSEAEL